MSTRASWDEDGMEREATTESKMTGWSSISGQPWEEWLGGDDEGGEIVREKSSVPAGINSGWSRVITDSAKL